MGVLLLWSENERGCNNIRGLPFDLSLLSNGLFCIEDPTLLSSIVGCCIYIYGSEMLVGFCDNSSSSTDRVTTVYKCSVVFIRKYRILFSPCYEEVIAKSSSSSTVSFQGKYNKITYITSCYNTFPNLIASNNQCNSMYILLSRFVYRYWQKWSWLSFSWPFLWPFLISNIAKTIPVWCLLRFLGWHCRFPINPRPTTITKQQ